LSSGRIVIIDYGMGNLASIQNMLKHVGVLSSVSSDADEIAAADKLVLPGVGAFDNGMKSIAERGLRAVLDRRALENRVPVLGICLGMQLFARRSEEGTEAGLGWMKADTIRFRFDGENAKLRVPHMGWNVVEAKKESVLFAQMYDEPRFYFVHSYHVVCDRAEDVLSTTPYGFPFTSAVEKGNLYGVQFHPEKSHKFGMRLLKNFAERA